MMNNKSQIIFKRYAPGAKERTEQDPCTVSANFSLVDMLVVISIIGILLSMLLPALNSARSSAKSTSCIGRIRQHGLAYNYYANDYDGFYPTSHDNPAVGKSYVLVGWTSNLPNWNYQQMLLERYGGYAERAKYNTYLRGSSLLVCPGSSFKVLNNGNYSNYGLNLTFIDGYFGYQGCHSAGKVKFPGKTMLTGDSGGTFYMFGRTAFGSGTTVSFPHGNEQSANFFFVDGHSENRNKKRVPYTGTPFPGFNGNNTYFWSGLYSGSSNFAND